MNRRHTRAVLVALALLAAGAAGRAAPVADEERLAREGLDALKKKLPATVAAWAKQRLPEYKPEVRVVRWAGDRDVKVRILLRYDNARNRLASEDHVLSVLLHYHGGRWGAEVAEPSWPSREEQLNRAAHFLLLAIDEAAEK
jgi:hypothetical protein